MIPRTLLWLVAALIMLFQTAVLADQHSFVFTLSKSGNTSAGVFDTSGNLVRTLWGNEPFTAGAHARAWDGRDDAGRHVSSGNYTMRVRSSDVTYTWEGVIGNTSASVSGPSKHHYFQFLNTMAIAGDYAYYGVHYNEGWTAQGKFALSNPQARIAILPDPGTGMATEFVATDGTTVYWAGSDPYNMDASFVFGTKTSDDTEVLFPNGVSYKATHGRTYPKCIAFVQTANSVVSGLAVQKTGNYLFVARKTLNQIQVVNKTTGALVQTLTHTAPGFLAIDGSDANLWMQSGTSINKYTVQANGTLSASILTVNGLVRPVGLAASPDNTTLLVADAGSSQQIKAFNNSTGASVWTHGTAGGYANDPTVTDQKFYFSDQTTPLYYPMIPFVCYQPNGTFWVGDAGNYRVQHYTANRTFIERLMALPHSYSVAADPNAPARVFNEYLEFAVDYTKPLAGNNGSWSLVRNWRGGVPNAFYQDYMVNILRSVITLSNGRTYALLQHISSHKYHVVELPSTGPLRFTGIELGVFTNDRIDADGSLRTYTNGGLGGTATWKSRALTGFDAAHNPVWASPTPLASISPVTGNDPFDWGHSNPSQTTSTNLVISFDPGKVQNGHGHGWHLGAVAVGGSAWKWRTAMATGINYMGPYPSDGGFDTGNTVHYPGGDVLVSDRSIFWSYHGEFWKAAQTNMWNHVYDDGLMVGQFGVARAQGSREEGAPAMAGNVLSVASVKDAAGNVYIYHNDESNHSGVHRWKVTGLNTIQEQNFPVTLAATTQGLLGEFFSGTDLNNARLLRSAVDSTVNLTTAPAASFSARWSGFVEPVSSQTYTVLTSVPRGVRLWVDEQLVVDQWTAAAPAEYSAAIAMVAGRRYPIRLECFGATGSANVSLSWSSASQSKVLIPSAQLLTAVAPDRSAGVNLLEGLSHDAVLKDNLYGWRRTPADEDLTNRYAKYWTVKSGHTTYGRFSPTDIYILYRQSTGNYSVTRDLGALPAQVMSWKLDGRLNWLGNYENNESAGGCFIEVLDAAGKVIARFWSDRVWVSGLETHSVTLRANGQIMASGYSAVTEPVSRLPQPLSISARNGQITLSYGPYAAITTGVFDPTSNWQSPQVFRLNFFSNNSNNDRCLSLENLRFAANSGDADNDGLTDAWELTHSLNPNSAADAALDSDGDGSSNLQEYQSGTDPRSRTSRFAPQVNPASAGQFHLSFEAMPGRSYSALYKNSLTDLAWQSLSQIPPATSATSRAITDTPPPGTKQRFYRIVTPAQP